MSATPEPADILVVDDTAANRDLLERRLSCQGHRVIGAADGLQALALMQQHEFDLVLLDIMMPRMNGFELLERLQADARLQHVPVILISALDDVESMARGIAMGAADYLPKPFNRHILAARVESSLARKRLRDREQIHARSLERELNIARDIQASFLPRQLPAVSGWQLAAWFEPARRVGGDFYDAFELADRRLVVAIGDVCDKGVGAALFMALFRTLLRALGERMLATPAPAQTAVCALVQALDGYIHGHHGDTNMFATLFVGVIDGATGALAYVNAGHEPALLVSDQGGARELLAPTGGAVGLLPGLRFDCGVATLSRGEALVLYTDGITDARSAAGEPFADARLHALVQAPAPSAQALAARLRDAVKDHTNEATRFDDSTLLIVQRSDLP